MAIQSSINSLLSQAQSLAAFYSGFNVADKIVKDQKITKNEAKIQTDIASGNAPMKDGKVDPDWLQKRRDQYMVDKYLFSSTGELTRRGEWIAEELSSKRIEGKAISYKSQKFLGDSRVQEYLKSFNESTAGRVLANKRVVERTDSINQAKADFNAHTASLIKKYGKGSGNP